MLLRLLLSLAFVLTVTFGFHGVEPIALDAVAHADDEGGCSCCDEGDDCCVTGVGCPCGPGPVVIVDVAQGTGNLSVPTPLLPWSLPFDPAARERASPPPTPPPIG